MRTTRSIAILLAGVLTHASHAAAQGPAGEPGLEQTAPATLEIPAEPVVAPQPAPAPAPAPAVAPSPTTAPAANFLSDVGILFSLNNVFVNSAILSSYRGYGVGAQYALFDNAVLRAGLALSHATDPATIRKNTLVTGDDRVVTYQLDATGPTATWGTALGVDLLFYLLEDSKLTPYVGGGPALIYSTTETKYKDDLTVPDQVTTVNNAASNMRLSLLGVLGLAWRVHQHFSFYAEYGLGIGLVDWVADHQQTTRRNSVGGVATTSRSRSEAEETRFFHLQLGLTQGASFGLIAHLGGTD